MAASDLWQLLGGALFGLPLVVFTLSLLIGMFLWPLLLWSATRNLKLIRRQLERLNDILEARPGSPRTGPLGL